MSVVLLAAPSEPETARRVACVTLKNRGDVPALFVHLDLNSLDPTRWHVADNYFTVLPGESREVRVDLLDRNRSADAASPWTVAPRGWNTPEVFQDFQP